LEAFYGNFSGDRFEGTLESPEFTDRYPFAAQREPVNLTGLWEWSSPTDGHPVQIKLDRRDGILTARYQDVVIHDFYDCGGGIYFTMFLEQGQATKPRTSTTYTPADFERKPSTNGVVGWVVGEGVVNGDHLDGTIEFYPHPNSTTNSALFQVGSHEWHAKRVKQ